MLDTIAYARYTGLTRNDIGLHRNTIYEVLENRFTSCIRVRTGKGLELDCPVQWFSQESRPRLRTGVQVQRMPLVSFGARHSKLDDGRRVSEYHIPGLRIIKIK